MNGRRGTYQAQYSGQSNLLIPAGGSLIKPAFRLSGAVPALKTNHEGLNTSALTNNQLSGYGYDTAGNMISNGSATYFYDAENRLITAGGMSYVYDGGGNRVEKCTQGTTPGTCASGATGTLYWRGTSADPQAEWRYATSGPQRQ
jgi:hypothetical protein